MALLEWNDRFNVNDVEMDSHHKKIFGIINKLYDSIHEHKDEHIISTITAELIQYSRYHFSAEEKLMSECHYPGIAQQIDEHALFIEKAWGFLENLYTDYAETGSEVFDFLKEWWYCHIILHDMDYKEYVTQKP